MSGTATNNAPKTIDWNVVMKWSAGVLVGAAVFALEYTGKAPQGTFLTLVAAPTLTGLGFHTAAKTLN